MYRRTQRYQERRRLRQRAMQEGKARAHIAALSTTGKEG